MKSKFAGILTLLFLSLHAAAAQQSMNLASLSGHIEDPSGAAVAGAIVQILNVNRNQSSEFTSDPQGRFRFPYLPVGAYEVRIQKAGFQPVVRKINLSLGQA